jgi:hypothetical protein
MSASNAAATRSLSHFPAAVRSRLLSHHKREGVCVATRRESTGHTYHKAFWWLVLLALWLSCCLVAHMIAALWVGGFVLDCLRAFCVVCWCPLLLICVSFYVWAVVARRKGAGVHCCVLGAAAAVVCFGRVMCVLDTHALVGYASATTRVQPSIKCGRCRTE